MAQASPGRNGLCYNSDAAKLNAFINSNMRTHNDAPSGNPSIMWVLNEDQLSPFVRVFLANGGRIWVNPNWSDLALPGLEKLSRKVIERTPANDGRKNH